MDNLRLSDLIFVTHGGLVHPVALHAVGAAVSPGASHA